jgi:hypothetical protein
MHIKGAEAAQVAIEMANLVRALWVASNKQASR